MRSCRPVHRRPRHARPIDTNRAIARLRWTACSTLCSSANEHFTWGTSVDPPGDDEASTPLVRPYRRTTARRRARAMRPVTSTRDLNLIGHDDSPERSSRRGRQPRVTRNGFCHLVGVDGSANGIAALKWGAHYAKSTDGIVHAVYVWSYPTASIVTAPLGSVMARPSSWRRGARGTRRFPPRGPSYPTMSTWCTSCAKGRPPKCCSTKRVTRTFRRGRPRSRRLPPACCSDRSPLR